jgi:hypothetical protein
MRLFEILLVLLCLTDAFARFRFAGNRPAWTSAIPLVSFFFAIIHIAGEGGRWQMVPVYIVVLTTFTTSLVQTFQAGEITIGGERLSRVIGGFIATFAVVSLIAGTAFPVFELEKPAGHYVVGTLQTELGDIHVRVHYPSDRARGERATYAQDDLPEHITYLQSRYGIPAALLGHLNLVRTYSFPAASLSAELPRFRVLIACPEPDRSSARTTGIAEDLASRGFVVITPSVAETPNGSGHDDRQVFVAEVVMDRLEAFNPNGETGWLADRLDFASVGVYGFGKAGETAAMASVDGSFRAGASIGSGPPTITPTTPFLYLHPEEHPAIAADTHSSPTYSVSMSGAMDDNFGDDAFVSPLMPAFGAFGRIDARRASLITSAYLAAFFNKHLTRGTVEPLLDDPNNTFEEVTFLAYNTDP